LACVIAAWCSREHCALCCGLRDVRPARIGSAFRLMRRDQYARTYVSYLTASTRSHDRPHCRCMGGPTHKRMQTGFKVSLLIVGMPIAHVLVRFLSGSVNMVNVRTAWVCWCVRCLRRLVNKKKRSGATLEAWRVGSFRLLLTGFLLDGLINRPTDRPTDLTKGSS
jgi:hypothetical protein